MTKTLKIYFYKNGNECTNLTGGWHCTAGTITRNSDHFFIAPNSTSHCRVYMANKYDLTGIKRLGVKMETLQMHASNSQGFYYGTSTTQAPVTTDFTDKAGWKELGYKEHYLTLTKNGSLYVAIDVYNAAGSNHYNVNLYELWAETEEDAIRIHSQDDSSINFTCEIVNKLLTIVNVEIYINDKLAKVYDDGNYNNLTYDIDKSLCDSGYNFIKIKINYTQGDTIETIEEAYSLYVPIDELPTTNLSTDTALKEIFDRYQQLLHNIKQQKNMLKTILQNKNVEIAENEDKLSTLINKVNELGNIYLWLYKDGQFNNYYIRTPHLASIINYIENNSFTLNGIGSPSYVSRIAFEEIDFTHYSKLHIDCLLAAGTSQSSRNATININTTMNYETLTNPLGVKYTSSFNRGIKTIDISNISGVYYLNLTTFDMNLTIYNIWLEK